MAVRTVEIALLGGFGIVVDGVPLDARWPTRRARELVELLALAPGHALPRDAVVDALWPHLDATAGGAQLRKAAHHARQALGTPAAVVVRTGEVALFPEATVTTDVAEFLAAAERAQAGGDADAARATASRWRGELLPHARYEEWTLAPRRLLADRRADLLRLAGDWAGLLDVDPADEHAARAAMGTALAAGQRHRAIDVYGRLRVALAHLGATPEAATEALYDDAIRGLSAPRRALVGRHRELAVLDDVVAAPGVAIDVVAVRGPAGIGKTALLGELVGRLGQRGWRTASVVAHDPGDPYGTLIALIERVLADDPGAAVDLDPATRAVLSALTPAVDEPADGRRPAPTRHHVVGAVQRLIEVITRTRPLAVAVDDAHLADGPSLAAVAMLGDREVGRTVIVLAHRDAPVSPVLEGALGRVARRRPPVVVTVDALRPDDAAALARAVRPDLGAEALGTVVDRAAGNPFCVLELAAAGSSGGPLAADVGRAIEARFVELAPDQLDALRGLAVIDGPIELAVAEALDVGPQALDAALRAGVLEIRHGAYAFRHDLVRAALADGLDPPARVRVHRAAAVALAARGARPSKIAAHWQRTDEPELAVPWLLDAAHEALRIGGLSGAVEHLDAALAVQPTHAEALRLRAVALDGLGDPRALAAYDTAIAAADPDDLHELRPLQALAQIKMGDPVGALVTIAGAEPRSLDSQLARALTFSGAALLGAAGPERGSAFSAAGRRAALSAGDPTAVVVASWSNAAAAHARGELRESLRIDLTDTSALPRLATTVFDGQLCITQRLLYGERPYADVIAWTNRFAAEAQRLGAARGVAFATTLRGEAELLSGQLAAADADLAWGRELHRAIDAPTGEAFAMQRRAEVALANGDRRAAARLLDEALAIARGSDVGFHLFDRIYGTRIGLAEGTQAAYDAALEAEDAVRGPLETCPGCRITLDMPAGIAVARAGDLERLARYEQTCAFLADVVMHLPAWDAALDEFRGHAALARGRPDEAQQRFAEAAAGFATAGQPLDAARCAAAAAGQR